MERRSMPRNDLIGKRVAILATDGVEAVELIDPRNALDKVGAKTLVVSPKHDKIRSWERGEWGDDIPIDLPLAKCSPDDFEALFLPGGVINGDRLRLDVQAVQFVRRFFETGKPVAAICHAPWILIEANVVRNRTVTSWPSLQGDRGVRGGDSCRPADECRRESDTQPIPGPTQRVNQLEVEPVVDLAA
jgi:protease I